MTSAAIPWGSGITLDGVTYSLQIADINIGILYIFAVVSFGVYGIMIGGWASNNKRAGRQISFSSLLFPASVAW
jgi:NADH-quinone oxidoreductase subunit H